MLIFTCACAWAAGAHNASYQTSDEQGAFPFDSYIKRLQLWDKYNHSSGYVHHAYSAVSGIGSHSAKNLPFIRWLVTFLRQNSISSLLEVSCGHWPSGWQRWVEWPSLDYVGVDMMSEMAEANSNYLSSIGNGTHGLRTWRFEQGDMVTAELPRADVLLTKDTLIHIPNRAIQSFLKHSVLVCPPRYKFVVFVHSYNKEQNNNDTDPKGTFHYLDMSLPPFSLNVTTPLLWYLVSKHTLDRIVQVYDTSSSCAAPNARAERGHRSKAEPRELT